MIPGAVVRVLPPPPIPAAKPPSPVPPRAIVALVVGPPGETGGQAAYEHVQALPSTVWDVEHGLGWKPAGILVKDLEGNTYWPDIVHLDNNTTRLFLPDSVTGTANLS